MTHRALELMALPAEQCLFLLDIGCGSGLSGEILDEMGHIWAGVDIAPSMLGEFYGRRSCYKLGFRANLVPYFGLFEELIVFLIVS